MKKVTLQFSSTILIASLLSSCVKDLPCPCDTGKEPTPTVSVFSTGLNNPRGLKFGPDGYLYVAEAGVGGTNSSAGQCDQVVFPIGPYLGSPTGGRISKVSSTGARTTVTDQLPTSHANEIIGGDVEGVSDVEFIGNTLYGLLAGAGCSHGVPSVPNGVVKVASDGSWSLVANTSDYVKANPVKNPNVGDFEPDGTPYSMVNVGGALYAIEPNHGELMKITTDGKVSRVADISASQGHIVPTAIAYYGNFFVGNLNPFPIKDGSSKIYRITPSGEISVWSTGLTTVLGLAFDKVGKMYVVENTTGNNALLTPGTGKVIEIDQLGNRRTIATGLNLPTGITVGPDNNLYVSNVGFGPQAIGGGEVLKIDLHTCKCGDVLPPLHF